MVKLYEPQNMFTRNSYAKINIGLNLVEKRPDGFHNIETIFQQISLHDTMTFRLAESTCIECADSRCPSDKTNLAYQAVEGLAANVDTPLGVRIKIDKKIPIGSGLGGGSSNAACTLLAVSELLELNLSKTELVKLASKLGADVPFFLLGGTAFGSGKGEKLEPVIIPARYAGLLVVPSYSISTKWAYNSVNFSLTNRNKKSNFGIFFQISAEINQWRDVLKNDLETAAFSAYPELGDIIDQLYKHGAFYAQMSGSGSSLYGLFEHENDALKAKAKINNYSTFLFEPVT